MADQITDWEDDPVIRDLKKKLDDGEISRADFKHFERQFKQARMALGPDRWKLLNGPIEPGTEAKIAEALAILSRAPDVPPDPGEEMPGDPCKLGAAAEAEIAERRKHARKAIGNARLAGVRLSREYMELTERYVLGLITLDEMLETVKRIWGTPE